MASEEGDAEFTQFIEVRAGARSAWMAVWQLVADGRPSRERKVPLAAWPTTASPAYCREKLYPRCAPAAPAPWLATGQPPEAPVQGGAHGALAPPASATAFTPRTPLLEAVLRSCL